jgi:hypothetical protein
MKRSRARAIGMAIFLISMIASAAKCSPALSIAEKAAIASAHQAALTKCYENAKADSGTFAEYAECACRVDAEYNVTPPPELGCK